MLSNGILIFLNNFLILFLPAPSCSPMDLLSREIKLSLKMIYDTRNGNGLDSQFRGYV